MLKHSRSGAALSKDYQYKGSVRKPKTKTRQASAESLTDSKGEINAWNKRDLIEKIAGVVEDHKEGRIRQSAFDLPDGQKEELCKLVKAGLADRSMDSNGTFAIIGETIGDTIHETSGRLGFARKFCIKKDVSKGDEGRFRVRQKNVVSWIITKDSFIPRNMVNQPWLYPEVLTLATYITVSDNEEATAPLEFMEEKFQDGLEATMVREDNLLRHLMVRAAPVTNNVYTFAALTPTIFSNMQLQIQQWGIATPHAVMAIDLWTDMRTGTTFQAVYEPVSQLQLIEEGRLGKLYDTEIYTDGLRYDTLKVLAAGELFFLGNPAAFGGICEYSPLQSEPVSLHHIGVSARGWYLWQTEGMVVGNSRAVCWGYKTV